MTNNEIQLNKVNFRFQETIPILKEVSLTIRAGEFIGIVGPNGSGKTTLARLLNGNLQPASGTLFVDGLLSSLPDHQLAIKRLVTLVGSDPENQLITSTVFDEITFALQALDLDSNEIKRRSEDALDLFNLKQHRDTHPFYLSVGEKFRLLIAAALVRQPKYIVLDEITSMMDSHTRYAILQMLLHLRTQSKVGIILLTHRIDDLLVADRIIVLQNGQVEMDDIVASIFARALAMPEWNIEVPLVYQIRRLLPSESHEYFPELFRL